MAITGGVSGFQIVEPLGVSDLVVSGAWGYAAGGSGTVQLPANARVLHLSAAAGPVMAASLTINGGPLIALPSGQALAIEPRGNLVAPSLTFTNTISYFIEYVV